MASGRVERVDQLGVSASVINDLGLLDMINARRVPDAHASPVLDPTGFCQPTPRAVVS